MSKRVRDRTKKRHAKRGVPGAVPGTIAVNPESPPSVVRLIAYSRDAYIDEALTDLSTLPERLRAWPVVWLNIDGLGDGAVLTRLAEVFHIHPLAMEDVVNVRQRAKVETYDHQHFIVTHMPFFRSGHLCTEQLSLFLGRNFVVTFQEHPGWDCLDPVRDRIRRGQPHLRSTGADFLAYSLLDAVTDQYFPILEEFGERLEDLEDRIILRATSDEVAEIHAAKRELLDLRRQLWPLREVFNTLVRDPLEGVTDETRVYLRDCYDHAVRIIDFVETHREVCSDLMDLYLSSVSFRLNEVMKVLTIISVVFIPLTFVCSIYGMNFNTEHKWNMPELNWEYGYAMFWLVIIVVTVAQLLFFWRKGWMGKDARGLAPRDPV
jgi:magnesium transporter